jgi:hypothetical protein
MSKKEYKKEDKHRISTSIWENGIWGNKEKYYNSLEEAKKEAKKEKDKTKIYDNHGHLVHVEHPHNHEDSSYA